MGLGWAAAAVVGGFIALVWGADRFVIGAAATARNLGVSPLVVGLTVVGLGTSAPEMLVSAVAAATGNGGLSIGNAIGSNITNVSLVLGAAALTRPLVVNSKIIRRELPLLLGIMAVALLLMIDGVLGRVDGVLLLAGMAGMMGWVVYHGLRDREADPLVAEYEKEVPTGMSTPLAVFWLVLGLAVLLGSSHLLVRGADAVARHFGVTDLVIGLTVVAIGTSLPELAASIAAALKDEHDIAVGNVVGSNMFNLLGVLGLPGAIAPGSFDPAATSRDFPVMIGLTVLLLSMTRGFGTRGRLTRVQGAVLVTAFAGYLVLVYT
ncbi:MAG: calcium/sodium antiporter [Myxococcota bacterium]